jgi:soluble lytic murein transglycosylase-like protein
MTTNRQKYEPLVRAAARRFGIDADIAVAQINQESRFNPNAKSPAGAQGLAQFMPGTWPTYGNGSPFNPDAALEAWGKYMTKLLRQFNGRYDLALAGYNWGENRQTLRTLLTNGKPFLSLPHAKAVNGRLPAGHVPTETHKYVKTILGAAGQSTTGPGPKDDGSTGGGSLKLILFLGLLYLITR